MNKLLLILLCIITFTTAQNTECDYQKLTAALTEANNLVSSINGTTDYDIPTFLNASKIPLIPVDKCIAQIYSWTNYKAQNHTKVSSSCIHSDETSNAYISDPCCNKE